MGAQTKCEAAILRGTDELAERILRTLPPVEAEPERIIRCSLPNLERAVCRAVARCRQWSEFWMVKVQDEAVVDDELASRKAQKGKQ